MRYAVLSDIHGNSQALSAVLADADREGARALVCLGDLVGYGADPVACAEAVGERAAIVVAGNHEHGVLELASLRWFNAVAREAVRWTRAQLSDGVRSYLGSLPLTATLEDATLVHASPRRPEKWDYLLSAEDGFEVFGDFRTPLCFVGHSHCPGVWSLGAAGPEHAAWFTGWPAEVRLAAGRRYVINVGSVGQPRDRDPRAAYALWDLEERLVWIRRVEYDHRAAAARILEAGLPRVLAHRLASGS
ncbi:MAG: hypothetical protein A2X52_18170 [Candidatus Rokubacteria bacterium GWC2_70_16]|nr:MAG: hypothetical protein A2X52_18170 [Candidatus Rokubacteria bacterium GWC2_70_16]OGL18052.1 MAG: hypothetical protein A3K12_14900 [Candidatus Rokubacteria bacterium RIFCSPLOWO2_12_FULL_71_19]